MSSPDSVTEQRKVPSIPSLQDGSKKDQREAENPKIVSPRFGGDLEEGFKKNGGLSRSQERGCQPWEPSFRRYQARRPSLEGGGPKVIASSIRFQCLFFTLGDLLNSSVKNTDACP